MELCKPGSRFTFEFYFDRIKEHQLRELLWTITIGENDENGTHMHKLGHGKPLGLGSVKLVVESVETRSFNTETLSYCIDYGTYEQVNDMITATPFDETTTSFNEFMRLTDFNALTDIMDNKKKGMFYPISYPIASDGRGSNNSNASHQWFIANRSMGIGMRSEKSIKQSPVFAWCIRRTLLEQAHKVFLVIITAFCRHYVYIEGCCAKKILREHHPARYAVMMKAYIKAVSVKMPEIAHAEAEIFTDAFRVNILKGIKVYRIAVFLEFIVSGKFSFTYKILGVCFDSAHQFGECIIVTEVFSR